MTGFEKLREEYARHHETFAEWLQKKMLRDCPSNHGLSCINDEVCDIPNCGKCWGYAMTKEYEEEANV